LENPYTTIDHKSRILDFAWQLKKDGLSDRTITNYSKFLGMLIKRGADLSDGESVKSVIALHPTWKSYTKSVVVAAYRSYAKMYDIHWRAPKYEAVQKMPFIPLESEIDALIAFCGRKVSTVLQLLKETGMRVGEALDLEWTDVDFESRIILLNKPEKHSNARSFKISEKLCAMLNRLKKDEVLVFGRAGKLSVIVNFNHSRKRAVIKLANPRLKQIHFHT
jgi:integrase